LSAILSPGSCACTRAPHTNGGSASPVDAAFARVAEPREHLTMGTHELLHGGVVLTQRLEQIGLRFGKVDERLDLALKLGDPLLMVGVVHPATLRVGPGSDLNAGRG